MTETERERERRTGRSEKKNKRYERGRLPDRRRREIKEELKERNDNDDRGDGKITRTEENQRGTKCF